MTERADSLHEASKEPKIVLDVLERIQALRSRSQDNPCWNAGNSKAPGIPDFELQRNRQRDANLDSGIVNKVSRQ